MSLIRTSISNPTGYRVLEGEIRKDAGLGKRLTTHDQSAVGILWGMAKGDRLSYHNYHTPPPGAGIENMVGNLVDMKG